MVEDYNKVTSFLDSDEYVYEDEAQFASEYLMEEVAHIFFLDGQIRLADYDASPSIYSNERNCNPSS